MYMNFPLCRQDSGEDRTLGNTVDHDGYAKCHENNIGCRNSTENYLLPSTQSSFTGQHQHHKDKTPIPAYIVQDVPKMRDLHS